MACYDGSEGCLSFSADVHVTAEIIFITCRLKLPSLQKWATMAKMWIQCEALYFVLRVVD